MPGEDTGWDKDIRDNAVPTIDGILIRSLGPNLRDRRQVSTVVDQLFTIPPSLGHEPRGRTRRVGERSLGSARQMCFFFFCLALDRGGTFMLLFYYCCTYFCVPVRFF